MSGCPCWSRGPAGADLALLGVRAELHTYTVCVRDAPEWLQLVQLQGGRWGGMVYYSPEPPPLYSGGGDIVLGALLFVQDLLQHGGDFLGEVLEFPVS